MYFHKFQMEKVHFKLSYTSTKTKFINPFNHAEQYILIKTSKLRKFQKIVALTVVRVKYIFSLTIFLISTNSFLYKLVSIVININLPVLVWVIYNDTRLILLCILFFFFILTPLLRKYLLFLE